MKKRELQKNGARALMARGKKSYTHMLPKIQTGC